MRTNIEAVLTPIWLLALSILVTIYLAWGFYYFDKKDIGSGQIQLKGLPLVCATNDYTEPTDMPADFSWSN